MTISFEPNSPGPNTGPSSPPAAATTDTAPSKELQRWRRRWVRLRMHTPKHRSRHVLFALLLIFGGMALAIGNAATPQYKVTPLAPSGYFFSLAMGGNTIYAASANSGSILLEKSSDRGLDWTTSAVPYSLIASNTSSWTFAAVAVDGKNVIVAAASSGNYNQNYGGYYGCPSNSTILLAASSDEGTTWKSQTIMTLGVQVTSIQVSMDGNSAAVAWLGTTYTSYCDRLAPNVAEAVTSRDGGQTWSLPPQNLTPTNAALSSNQHIEMAASTEGIVVAFESTSLQNSYNLLNLYRLDENGSGYLFHPVYGELPAPSSWTLQGDPGTSAFLLTPSYLIPLGPGALSGIPFSQLQEDSGAVGVLPSVISLVPAGSGAGGDLVTIAATLPGGTGVDCWTVNLGTLAISQTCHVTLGSFLLPSSQSFPIVSLLYGDGWWVGIGAGSAPYGWGVGGYLASSPAVGTSVCFQGCQSEEGLVGYYYTETSTLSPSVVAAFAVFLVVLGIVWIFLVLRAGKNMRPVGPSSGGANVPPGGNALTYPRTAYLRGLLVWFLLWSPLSMLLFAPGLQQNNPLIPWLIVTEGVLGAIFVAPFHSGVRRSLVLGLQKYIFHNPDGARGFGRGSLAGTEAGMVSYFAYASWVATFFLLIAVGLFDTTSPVQAPLSTSVGGGTVLNAMAMFLVVMALAVAGLRVLYHDGLGAAMREATVLMQGPPPPATGKWDTLRTRVGAALLPWNPLVGLILGWALEPVLSWSPFVLAFLFLPVTLLGMAIQAGLLGRTAYSKPVWE